MNRPFWSWSLRVLEFAERFGVRGPESWDSMGSLTPTSEGKALCSKTLPSQVQELRVESSTLPSASPDRDNATQTPRPEQHPPHYLTEPHPEP